MPDGQIIAFLGPSLPRERAEAILDAEYRPPAAGGDVYLATLEGPAAILLIDGVFEDRPAVFHKEILWALSEGIHVFGAASIGALRAAELERFGMVGIGAIFRAYRDGSIDRDDAVAVLHGPEQLGYPPLSWALVDARATFAEAKRQGVIDDTLLGVLDCSAETIFYKERTCEAVIERAAFRSGTELGELADWIAANPVSQKALDAVSLLESVAALRGALDTPSAPAFRFEWTAAWDRLKRNLDRRLQDVSEAEFAALMEELRDAGLHEAVRHEALAYLLAEEAARERDPRFDRPALLAAAPSFRRKHGLQRAADVARWMAALDLSHADYVSMVSEDHRLAESARRNADRIPDAILRTLRRRGILTAFRTKVRAAVSREDDGPKA